MAPVRGAGCFRLEKPGGTVGLGRRTASTRVNRFVAERDLALRERCGDGAAGDGFQFSRGAPLRNHLDSFLRAHFAGDHQAGEDLYQRVFVFRLEQRVHLACG